MRVSYQSSLFSCIQNISQKVPESITVKYKEQRDWRCEKATLKKTHFVNNNQIISVFCYIAIQQQVPSSHDISCFHTFLCFNT